MITALSARIHVSYDHDNDETLCRERFAQRLVVFLRGKIRSDQRAGENPWPSSTGVHINQDLIWCVTMVYMGFLGAWWVLINMVPCTTVLAENLVGFLVL